jgi:hypothetical protein
MTVPPTVPPTKEPTSRRFLEPDPTTGLRLTDVQRRVVIAVILVVALVGIVVATRMAVTGDDSTSEALPDNVDRVIPASGAEVLRQATVGIDVADGYDAYLVINGVEITTAEDGLIKDLGTGLVQFIPGPGKPVETLSSERNCVIAMVWDQTEGQSAASPVNWCFTAA